MGRTIRIGRLNGNRTPELRRTGERCNAQQENFMFAAILVGINIIVIIATTLAGKIEKKPGDGNADDRSDPDYPCV
jgi:hypothetical protein